MSARSEVFDDAASEDSVSELDGEVSIDKLVEHIVKNKLGQKKADISPWVKALQDNLISTKNHLKMVDPKSLHKIGLPAALQAMLLDHCKSGAVRSGSSVALVQSNQGERPSINRKPLMITDKQNIPGLRKSVTPTMSQEGSEKDKNYFGLTDEERDAVAYSWRRIVEKRNTNEDDSGSQSSSACAEDFFRNFWDQWLRVDEKAVQLFKSRTFEAKTLHMQKVMAFIVRAAETPKDVYDELTKLPIPHCIWAIKSQSFSAFGLTLINALEHALGENAMTPSLKESWLTLVSNLGTKITDGYDNVKNGWVDTLFKREGQNWKKVWTKLTDNTLYLFKSSSMKKSTEKYDFILSRDVSSADNDELNPINKWCFYIQFGTVKKYFCATSEQRLKEWMDNLIWRVKSYMRLQDDDKDSSQMFITTEEKNAKARREAELAIVSKVKGEKLYSKEKNKKLLIVRNHLDQQIKKDAEFILFDNLLHATIVIDERGTIEYVNPACIDLTGYDPSQLVSRNVNILMPASIAKLHDGYLARYLKTGDARIIGVGRYVSLRHSKGFEISCFLTVTEHTLTGRRLFIGTLTEGGEESASSSSEQSVVPEITFSVFDNLLQATIVITQEGIIEYVNNATQKFVGFRKEEMLGKNVKMLMNTAISSKHDQYLRNYVTTRESKIIGVGRDVPIQHKSGNIMNGHLEVTENKIGNNKSYFIGTLIPKDEMSLEYFVEEHRDIIGSLDVPVLIIGEDGVIHLYNKSAQKSFGYRESQVKGKNVNILMTKDHARKHNSYIRNYTSTGKGKVIGKGRIVTVKCKSGNVRQCHLTVSERAKGSYRIFIGILAILY